MLPEYFVYIAFCIGLTGALLYAWDVLKGRIQPSRVSHSIWALAPLIAFFASISEGVGTPALLTLGIGLGPVLSLIASYISKSGNWKSSTADLLLGIIAIFGIFLWWITGEGALAIAFSIAADFSASIPTVKKSFTDPKSENQIAFSTAFISAFLVILTIDNWNFETWAFPIYIAAITSIMFSLIQFRIGPRFFNAKPRQLA